MQQTAVQQQWLPNVQCSSETSRRMSEPCHSDLTECKSPPPRPSSVQLSPLKPGEHHPNQEVVLDEVEEGEMVENKLVIPDEMVHYLSQVADNQNSGNQNNWQASPANNANLNQLPCQSNYNQLNPASEEIMSSSTNKPNNCVPSPMSSNNITQVVSAPCTFNRYISSPPNLQNNLPQPSPPILNHVVNSPGTSNMSQIVHSPGTSNVSQILPSSNPSMNPMMPSPLNLNQMIPSPASTYSTQMINPTPSSSNSNQISTHMLMSPRSHTQLLSPAQQGMHSPGSQVTCTVPRSPAAQMPTVPNNVCMTGNNCSNRHGHVSCYTNWNNSRCPKTENLCSPRVLHNQQHCQSQIQHTQVPVYNSSNNEKTNHCYQNCNQFCIQNKPFCQHKSRAYPQMHSPGVACNQQISEPLSSPAVANTAPIEQMGPPQAAQMSRPCNHTANYDQTPQQCYTYNNVQNCSVNKVGCYSHHSNKMCYHQNDGMTMEIQCKDISQSQISPGLQQTNTTNMRHDTYQRTLEYVQNCQSWVSHPDMVSSSTHPIVKCSQDTSNMIINDMSSSLTSLLEENRYLQMIQ